MHGSEASRERYARRVAFLRGINLGGRRITNDELAAVVEALDGVSDVTPYQASGNVVFSVGVDVDPAELEARFERHFQESLGYPVDTLVRTMDELAEVAEDGELTKAKEDGFKAHVIFLRSAVDAEARNALGELEGPDDRFPVRGREVAWLRRGRLTDSEIETRHLEKALGGRANTMRTLGTVQRIVRKFGGGE